MLIQEIFYTAEDLWTFSHLPENEFKRFELSEGMLIVMSPAGSKHGSLAARSGRIVGNFVEEHDLGETTAAEAGYILFKNPNGKDTVRAPDVGFVSKARIPEGEMPDGYFPGPPDLAIEVVSPTDNADDIQLKITEYLKYGTKMVWVFYSKSRTVIVHTPDSTRTLHQHETLDGGDVLPGFKLAIRDIFRG